MFSIAFSLPTFLIYILCFKFLDKNNIQTALAKAILIAVSALGIFITISIIEGSMSQDIAIAYLITTIIIGLLLKLRITKIYLQSQVT